MKLTDKDANRSAPRVFSTPKEAITALSSSYDSYPQIRNLLSKTQAEVENNMPVSQLDLIEDVSSEALKDLIDVLKANTNYLGNESEYTFELDDKKFGIKIFQCLNMQPRPTNPNTDAEIIYLTKKFNSCGQLDYSEGRTACMVEGKIISQEKLPLCGEVGFELHS